MKKTLDDALLVLQEAEAAYTSAQAKSDIASREASTRLNGLNVAQKAVDKAYDALRAGSAYQSDWKRTKGLPVE